MSQSITDQAQQELIQKVQKVSHRQNTDLKFLEEKQLPSHCGKEQELITVDHTYLRDLGVSEPNSRAS